MISAGDDWSKMRFILIVGVFTMLEAAVDGRGVGPVPNAKVVTMACDGHWSTWHMQRDVAWASMSDAR